MFKKLVFTQSQTYNQQIIRPAKEFSNKYDKICYVSLNKSFRSLKNIFAENNMNSNKFCFLDLITPSVIRPKLSGDCDFIDSIEDLNEFTNKLLNTVKLKKVNAIIIDSISSFLIYKEDKEIIDLFNYLFSFLEKMNIDILMFALSEDKEKPSLKQLKMAFTEVIEIKNIENG